jgi:hypothetical protein
MDYYILSWRANHFTPAQAVLNEFEDVLIESCDGTLISPKIPYHHMNIFNRIKQYIPPLHVANIPKKNLKTKGRILILVSLSIWHSLILRYIAEWRSIFDIVCAYIFDAFLPVEGLGSWRFHNFRKLVNSMDYLFIPMTGSLEQFRQTFKVPVAMVPLAADVIKFGSPKSDRFIDLMGYGRQDNEHSRLFENAFNLSKSNHIYYHTGHMTIERINDFYAHRRLFWKLLCNSRIALAYDPLKTNPLRFTFSFVGQRWFECIAAGCLIVGRRPSCPEMGKLFHWEDATLELPEEKMNLIPFIEDLLNDHQRLQSAHRRNYLHALTTHDWHYRLAEILEHLSLPQPVPLQRALAQLQESCESFKC